MRIPSGLDDDDDDGLDDNEDEDDEICSSRGTTTDGPTLSFTPQQAHIFGGQSIFLSFANTEAPLSKDIFYYVVFKGSKIQHITSAKVLNPYTLQAVIPDHNDAELVILSVYQHPSDSNDIDTEKNLMATDTFVYTSDSSQFLTQQLALNVDNSPNLLNLQNVYSSLLDISKQDKKSLDYKLTASFRNILLPPNWSLVPKNKREDEKSWTLLHFCAKYNLPKLAEYLLVKPGAKEALKLLDERHRSPLDIANLTKHKKMMEVLTRIPCDEVSQEQQEEKAIKRPSVKRHKLGTTTFTNDVSDDEDVTMKDLMLLRELDTLATTSKGSQKNGAIEMTDHPLAESLKKLQEINDEIRRLRDINSSDNFESLEKDIEDSFEGGDMVLKDAIDTCNGNSGYLVDENMNERDTNDITADILTVNEEKPAIANELHCENSLEISPQIQSLEEKASFEIDAVSFPCEIEDISLNISNQDEEISADTPHLIQRSISINKVEVSIAEDIEFAPTQTVEVTPVVDVVLSVIKSEFFEDGTEVSEEDGDAGTDCTDATVIAKLEGTEISEGDGDVDIDCTDANFIAKLESVTEETEEELSADGSGRLVRSSKVTSRKEFITVTEAHSLNELPPHPPKRVSALRKSKKDRPLSDSYENLRMVENQGIVDFFTGRSLSINHDEQKLCRGHSLDALTPDIEDGDDNERSAMSVHDRHDSQESISSDSELSLSRLNSDSGFNFHERCDGSQFSIGSQRTLSLLSLNDWQRNSRHTSTSSNEEVSRFSKKSSSLLHRLSFKAKSKSMTALDTKGKHCGKDDDDRRRTISGARNADFLGQKSPDGRLVRCESYDDQVKKSKSPSLKKSKGSLHSNEHSDEDTDEGTSHDIGKQHITERKTIDDKQKGIFGILRSKSNTNKERKGSKEKEKKEEKVRERKDSDCKQSKKKTSTGKLEAAVTNKSDSKAGVLSNLSKRGSSFRQNFNKPVAESKITEKSMLMRGSAALGNSNPFNKRSSSERKSPSTSNKFNPQIAEIPEGGNDVGEQHNLQSLKTLSSSQTSLNSDSLCYDDDADAPLSPSEEVEYDSDLDKVEESETWSELVDKKVQRKMHAKDIKRQDVIYELIQTEGQYVRNLQIMKKIYADGMMRHLHYEPDVVNAIFPVLEDLIELNGTFLRDMKEEQKKSPNSCVESIGLQILKSFDGESGKLFKEKYGYFCSHHLEAVALYRELLRSDKKFQQFVKACLLKERTRRLSVPECITYVTIRLTKYPLLIEAIIKATKEANPDYANLKRALDLVKGILVGVDEAVENHEQEKELGNLRKNLDRKNVVEIKNEGKTLMRFKASKLFHKRSRLLYDKKVQLKSKNKIYETRMVILAEKIIFLQESGGKLQLLNVDNKMPVMLLKGVMMREVAIDPKALFLMNTSKELVEIYEIVFEKAKEKTEFMPKLKKFIDNCPGEEEENLTDNEEEARREEEERMMRMRDIIEQLDTANQVIAINLEDKNKIVRELRKLIESMDEDSPITGGSPCSETKPLDIYNARVYLEDCLAKANAALLASSSTTSQNDSPVSSPGQTNNTHNPSLVATKKADTFGGFDSRNKTLMTNNVNRTCSMKPLIRPGISEPDIAPNKRRQSQLMQVLSRTKTMGSNEDLASLSSSTSTLSLSNFNITLSQVQLYQLVSERLGSLVEVTNQQDLEIAKMRDELQKCRTYQAKAEVDLVELREKYTAQQKEHDRQLRIEKENYAKLSREFKRNKDKNQKMIVEQQRHLKATSEEVICHL